MASKLPSVSFEFNYAKTFNSITDQLTELESDGESQTESNLDLAYHRIVSFKETILQEFKQSTGVDWLDACRHLSTSGIRKQEILDEFDIVFGRLFDINKLQNKLDKMVFSKWQRD